MTIQTLSLAIAGLVFIYLVYKIISLKTELKMKDLWYVDTSGIPTNPPENFIDVMRNKTINFDLGKYKVKITQLPILICLNYIERLAGLFNALKVLLEYQPKSKLDTIKHHILYLNTYKAIVNIVYRLSYSFVNNKKGYKKYLYKKSRDDIQLIVRIVEEILDYWAMVKKKIHSLSKGQTLRQEVGVRCLDYVKLDGNGKILLKPRYVPISNISKN